MSPKLVKATIIFGIITVMLSIISYLYIDRSLVLTLHNDSSASSFLLVTSNSLSTIFEPKAWAVLFAIVAVISLWLFFVKKVNSRLYVWTLSLFLCLAITTTLKWTLARYRPELLLNADLYGFHGFSTSSKYNSFPSGHSSLAFAGLLGGAYLINKKSIYIIFTLIAILIVISRILSGQHYLSDVLVGSYIGIFCFLWSKSVINYFCKKQQFN